MHLTALVATQNSSLTRGRNRDNFRRELLPNRGKRIEGKLFFALLVSLKSSV